jgi:hypothetical protein
MVRTHLAAGVLSLLTLAAGWPAASLEVQPLALEALGPAAQPSVVADPARGRFVLSWQARLPDGCAALRAAELRPEGRLGPVREAARGCNWFVNWGDFPALAIADNGDWLTYWLPKTGQGTYAYEIRTRRSIDRGRTWEAPVVVHTDATETEHGFVSMAPAGDDRILLVWLDGRAMAQPATDATANTATSPGSDHSHAGRMSLRSAILRRGGVREDEAQVDSDVCSCCTTDLVRVSPGEHLAVYRDRSEHEIRDIGIARRDSAGWRGEGLVHADNWRIAACPTNGPALATRAGQTLVAWPTMPDSQRVLLRARRLDAPGPVREIESGAEVTGRVDVAPWQDGWILSWLGAGGPGRSVLKVATWGPSLAERTRTDVADVPAGRAVGIPRLASLPGHAVLVWTEAEEPLPAPPTRPRTQLRGVRISPE